MTFLTTGTRSGFGRYCHDRFGGNPWTRDTSDADRERIRKTGVDVIIHCAFNSARNVTSADLYEYVADNVLLTEALTSIPHRKFVLMSTVDVYPKRGMQDSEAERIPVDDVGGIYGVTKLISEAIVAADSENHLILRCTALLGRHSRPNGLIRMLRNPGVALTLSAESRFNYVHYADVGQYIEQACVEDLRGIVNVASTGNVSLGDAARIVAARPKFGAYTYDVGAIDNVRIRAQSSAFANTSRQVVEEFTDDWRKEERRCS